MRTRMVCYLENRDAKVLPGTDAFERWLDPAATAVVCIDMHRGHVGPDAELTSAAPRARKKIPAHNLFHAACRDLGIPVIFAQLWLRQDGIDDTACKGRNAPGMAGRVLYPLYLPPNPLMDEHSLEGSKWLDLMVDTDPRDYYVRTKKRLSAFYPTDLEFLLRRLDVHNIVLTGTYTDACVLSTAFDAANRDFRVIVPRDIVAGYSAEAEDAALRIVSLHLGLVVDSPALLREWYARAARMEPALVEELRAMSEEAVELAGDASTGRTP